MIFTYVIVYDIYIPIKYIQGFLVQHIKQNGRHSTGDTTCMYTYKHTNTHIYTYIYQYDTINEFKSIHVQLCSIFTGHYHKAVLFMNRMAANAISGFHVL